MKEMYSVHLRLVVHEARADVRFQWYEVRVLLVPCGWHGSPSHSYHRAFNSLEGTSTEL